MANSVDPDQTASIGADCSGFTLFASILTRVGITGTTAKSRKRKFVPSSHPGPFTAVASSRKRQTKVGTLACFNFFVSE